jgi:hypothetical protein
VLDGQVKLVTGRLSDVEASLAQHGFQTHAQAIAATLITYILLHLQRRSLCFSLVAG